MKTQKQNNNPASVIPSSRQDAWNVFIYGVALIRKIKMLERGIFTEQAGGMNNDTVSRNEQKYH